MAVLLFPYLDQETIQCARNALAEIQGYDAFSLPMSLIHNPTAIDDTIGKHVSGDESSWYWMYVTPFSQWCTLLIIRGWCYMFDRWGAVCFFPRGVVKDQTLFDGTVLSGDLVSSLREDGKIVWVFTVVHVLVCRGMSIVHLPFFTRHKVAESIIDNGALISLELPSCAWTHKLAVVRHLETNKAKYQKNTIRYLHKSSSPELSSLWCVQK